MSSSGIYRIVNTVTDEFYIGSAVDIARRWRRHRSDLQRNIHPNPKLQASFNKYGSANFRFEIWEYVLPLFLIAREQYWFDELHPAFNLAPVAGSRLGDKQSLATCEKIGASQRDRKKSADHCAKIAASNRNNPKRMGKKRSLESREKQGARLRGVPQGAHSPETLAKINAKAEKRMITLILTDPSGEKHFVHGVKVFCREYHLDRTAIMRVAKGQAKQHKGWTARYAEPDAS